MRTLESILRAKTFQSMRLISSDKLNIIWSGRRELAYRQHLLALSTKSGFTPLVTQVWSGWADLNRRPLAPEASALPLSHTPTSQFTTAHPRERSPFPHCGKDRSPKATVPMTYAPTHCIIILDSPRSS